MAGDPEFPTMMDPVLNRILDGRYRIDRQLGVGAVGTVYLSTVVQSGQQVAVKVLRRGSGTDDKADLRFLREAQALARLDHPNIVGYLDFGRTADGIQYLVLELLEGEPLSAVVDRVGVFSVAEATDIGIQVLEALSSAHVHGVIHRDLKPTNLFVARDEDGERIKLIDFGVAKLLRHEETDDPLSTTNAILGSPRYMAPEQALNWPVGPQADLYAMAVILYEMITGRPLFTDESAFDYITAHVNKVPEWPSVHGQPLSGPLVELVVRCLAKDPNERPPSARAALAWLHAMLRATEMPTSDGLAAVKLHPAAEVPAKIIRADQRVPVVQPESAPPPLPPSVEYEDLSASQIWGAMPEAPTGRYRWWEIALLGLAAGAAFFVGLRIFAPVPPPPSAVATARAEDPPRSERPTASLALPAGHLSRRVDSEPHGAVVWLDGQRLGLTPLEVRWPTTMQPPVLQLRLGDWVDDLDLGATAADPAVLHFQGTEKQPR